MRIEKKAARAMNFLPSCRYREREKKLTKSCALSGCYRGGGGAQKSFLKILFGEWCCTDSESETHVNIIGNCNSVIDDNIIGDTIGHYYVNTIQKIL